MTLTNNVEQPETRIVVVGQRNAFDTGDGQMYLIIQKNKGVSLPNYRQTTTPRCIDGQPVADRANVVVPQVEHGEVAGDDIVESDIRNSPVSDNTIHRTNHCSDLKEVSNKLIVINVIQQPVSVTEAQQQPPETPTNQVKQVNTTGGVMAASSSKSATTSGIVRFEAKNRSKFEKTDQLKFRSMHDEIVILTYDFPCDANSSHMTMKALLVFNHMKRKVKHALETTKYVKHF
eukprot:GHVS01101062.1.p1 GENE.GHVS01101062.1~~GHVS01101062.1.p1  ORF type:complete len:232 (-),score=25.82 GHVS01101062.1:583-1278(-)